MLIFCVLFYASAMNLVIPTDRMLQVSPQEQFRGRRLNLASMYKLLLLIRITLWRPERKVVLLRCLLVAHPVVSACSISQQIESLPGINSRLFLYLISSLPIFLHKHLAKVTLSILGVYFWIQIWLQLESSCTCGWTKSWRPYCKGLTQPTVELDKALYGCVEATSLWYENPYDVCIFSKACSDGTQTTIALHVDDLMVSNVHESNLDTFYAYLKEV